MNQQYADIIVDISIEQLDRPFQYKIPDNLKELVTEGVVVKIPFGNGNRIIKGYVIGITDQPKFAVEKTKEILSVESTEETVESRLIALAAWMRENYGSTMIQALKTVIPVKKQVAKKRKSSFMSCCFKRSWGDISAALFGTSLCGQSACCSSSFGPGVCAI